MIKVYASIASVGFLVLASAACSSANTPDEGDGGSGGTSSSAAGKTSSTAGTTTVVPSGGSGSEGGSGSGTAGTANPSAGTSPAAGTGTGGTGTPGGAACKSIKSNMACMPEGQDCPDLKCGLADTGTRSCLCQGTWMCQSCDFTASPFKDKPDPLPECTTEIDKQACAGMEMSVCQYPGGEACACYPDDEGMPIWDCDAAPSSWAAAAAM